LRETCRDQQLIYLRCHAVAAGALDSVDLGDDAGDFFDPDQLQYVEMFEGLWAPPVIGGDDQQHPVYRQYARQHIGQETLVAWDIDKPKLGAVWQGGIGEAKIDGQPSPLLLGQAIGIDPGQRADQRGLAMVNMTGRRQYHDFLRWRRL
jgi:hypothetical protein